MEWKAILIKHVNNIANVIQHRTPLFCTTLICVKLLISRIYSIVW